MDQLTLLVANLLDSSRLAAGVVRPELTEVYLEEVVQRALVGIGGRNTIYGRASIDRVKVEVGATVAMGDAGLLERVLSNVIDNALRYAPGSMVRVNAGQVGPRVLINIIDEGPGMTPEFVRDELFRPFATTKGGGHGIGAYQARQLLREAGGDLLVLSRRPGGTTMRLLLPSVRVAVADAAAVSV